MTLWREGSGDSGIPPADLSTQSSSPLSVCGDSASPYLHAVCEDAALRELVASWHGLTPSVTAAIMELARYDRLGVIMDAWATPAASVVCFRILHHAVM
jgi:hypothetical protein